PPAGDRSPRRAAGRATHHRGRHPRRAAESRRARRGPPAPVSGHRRRNRVA
ncbi:hypothetical protein, partial [Amycolatopsis samaneae]